MSEGESRSSKLANTVQGFGNQSSGEICESCCRNRIKQIDDETRAIVSIDDPLERNKAITQAYTEVAAKDPDDRWVKLASVVSAQGGCAMAKVANVRSWLSWKQALDDKTGMSFSNNMYQALGDANKGIFRDIYPVAAYKARHGWADLKACYAEAGRTLQPELRDAFDKMEKGDLDGAADGIAKFEQMKVVQPVYDAYSGTFSVMKGLSALQKPIAGTNLFDIPVSTLCGDPNVVPFAGDIAKGADRVEYYRSLMDTLKREQGW
jgi:hypothetical protein